MKVTSDDMRAQRVELALSHAAVVGGYATSGLRILADEVLRLREINSDLVRDYNAQSLRIMQLEYAVRSAHDEIEGYGA